MRSSVPRDHPTRRALLIGGGAAAGMVLAWELWPRHYRPTLSAAADETVLGAFLKIATDGRIIVAAPQAELGQGIWTALAQALADELGADWRQVAVEPAPINPLYANRLLAGEAAADALPNFLHGVASWSASEWAMRHAFMVTAGSTSIRAFEQPFREAGAIARALLSMAAGRRIGADWRACDAEDGFIVRGTDRFRFGELATEAATFAPPAKPPLRRPGEGGIAGKSMPRLDLPAKVDGSTRYAGDVRLPGMVFAAIRHAPAGDSHLAAQDVAAADAIAGVVGVVRGERWIATLAETSWAAQRALDAMHVRFAGQGPAPDEASIARALDAALATGGTPLVELGGAAKALTGPGLVTADYGVSPAAHATIEPLVATARLTGDRLEIWAPTQAQSAMQTAVAAATGLTANAVTLYPTQAGGGFGRKIEVDAACEAAILALRSKRPVQLTYARDEELRAGRYRAPVKARLIARLGAPGRIAAWGATIATPAAQRALARRLDWPNRGDGAEHAALDGAVPPYGIPLLRLAHAPAATGIVAGLWRAGAHAANAFFTESFVDELAGVAGLDPLSFRMGQLGSAPRLARCLAQAAATGGWSGEPRAGQGLACHSAFGSHIALFAEAGMDGDRVRVARLVAAVDCGRMVNPEIVRQLIEGGLVWGMAEALGRAMHYDQGIAGPERLEELQLPRLGDMPEIEVGLIASAEAPGGVAELGVPVAAAAIANALASATGRRYRHLPFERG